VTQTVRLYRVPLDSAGARLDQQLAIAFPDLSRARIQALIESGCVRINGNLAKASRRLKGGEGVKLDLPPPAPAQPLPEDLPLTVLYEDDDIAVIDKAPGMVVHPAAGNWRGTLVNALLFRLKGLTGVGGTLRPGLVHRLDKGTSGCMVVAKNDRALTELQQAFKSRRVSKTYLALVHGKPPSQGKVEAPIGRHPVHRKRFTGKTGKGKSAVTTFTVREAFSEATLLEVQLHTGRTHQVRVHLSEAGHPLLGDALYGGARRGSALLREIQHQLARPALHAWRLAFAHPRTRAPLGFEAPLPADLENVLGLLRQFEQG
jgi:23S rRNA pseudouridine1911/1915/1917 synthase